MANEHTLTIEKVLEAMRGLPRGPRSDLFNPLRPRFMGMDIYDAPRAPPKIQVRDIKFADGTSILPAAFRAQLNAQLLERFGYQEDLFKDKVYILGNYALVAKPEYSAILRNCY